MTDAHPQASSPRHRLPVALDASLNPRYLIIFLIALVLVLGEWRYAILGGYPRLVIALSTCVVTELLLSWLLRGRVANVASAIISGISLSLLLKPQSGLLWPFWLGGFLAISSKYVLTYRNRHLWNPSNFAIGVMVLLAHNQVAILSHQWGNEIATNAVIWFFGLLIVSRARVLHVTLAYVVSFVVLAVARNALVGGPLWAEIAPITGPMYQLFVLFMITDPRTTVHSKWGRVVVAVAVAVTEMAVRIAADHQIPYLTPLYFSPPIMALFIVGPIAMYIDLQRTQQRGRFQD